ncbi:MAG: PfkB family carbohydrate kinase [Thermoleophilaceae bacterium]
MSGAAQLVVIGSLNTDLVVSVGSLPAPGETVTGGSFEMAGGGKGANQAVAAARAGTSVAIIGAVGADDFGARLIAELLTEGVDTAGVTAVPRARTGVAGIVVDEQGENQIAVASGANHELRPSDVEQAFEGLDLSRARCALFSFEVEDKVVLAGAALAAERGMALVVNPAPARRLPAALVELRPMLAPNQGEAAELTGHEDPAAAAGALAKRTEAPALVTAGARGVFVAADECVTQIEPPTVSVRDTTGAGDTFNGVLAGGVARGWSLDRAARWATLAAAHSVTKSGARGGMPGASEIEALASRIDSSYGKQDLGSGDGY